MGLAFFLGMTRPALTLQTMHNHFVFALYVIVIALIYPLKAQTNSLQTNCISPDSVLSTNSVSNIDSIFDEAELKIKIFDYPLRPKKFGLVADFERLNDPFLTTELPAEVLIKSEQFLISLTATIAARGQSRRRPLGGAAASRGIDILPFEIDIDHPQDLLKGTPFRKNGHSFDLVTHGKRSEQALESNYQQNILVEAVIHVLAQVWNPYAMRTQLAEVRYIDSSENKLISKGYAIIRESKKQMMKRLRAKRITSPEEDLSKASFRRFQTDFFSYFVADTDFNSPLDNRDAKFPAKNMIIGRDKTGDIFFTRYDFDLGKFAWAFDTTSTRFAIDHILTTLVTSLLDNPQQNERNLRWAQLMSFLSDLLQKTPTMREIVQSVPLVEVKRTSLLKRIDELEKGIEDFIQRYPNVENFLKEKK